MRQVFWIAANAQTLGVICSFLTLLVTAAYLFFTIRIFREARRSADAAEKSAAAAQRGVDFAAQEFAEQRGLGPQILRDALVSTSDLIKYWLLMTGVATGNPQDVPDPEPLTVPNLVRAQEHARRVSPECSAKVAAIINDLNRAKSEFERLKQSYRGPGRAPAGTFAFPGAHLDSARKNIDQALAIIGAATR
jgi:hypothetical protein